jgi:hypothetical protein
MEGTEGTCGMAGACGTATLGRVGMSTEIVGACPEPAEDETSTDTGVPPVPVAVAVAVADDDEPDDEADADTATCGVEIETDVDWGAAPPPVEGATEEPGPARARPVTPNEARTVAAAARVNRRERSACNGGDIGEPFVIK